jgi:hypothetical protein
MLLDHSKRRWLPESEQLVRSLLIAVAAAECGIWSIFMPMICSVQLLTSRDAKAAAGGDSLQRVKIVPIYFFTALTIEGHNRVPSLVDYALMRFDAFRMEVIEIRWAGPLGPRHVSF